MKHLTVEQRYTISVMKASNYSQKEIAKAIGKNKSVISIELKRNCDKRSGEYRHDLAQRKYETRMREKPKKQYLTDEIKAETEVLLKKDYSPKQIAGRLKKVWMVKLNGKNAPELAQKTVELLIPLKNIIHTITGDNGNEFADHQTISKKLAIDFYFARPYHSW